MSTERSRYKDLATATVSDHKGRAVPVLPPAPRGNELLLGHHKRAEIERLDHMAARYLKDPAGFWRIADINQAVLPDALTEMLEIAIPGGKR